MVGLGVWDLRVETAVQLLGVYRDQVIGCAVTVRGSRI